MQIDKTSLDFSLKMSSVLHLSKLSFHISSSEQISHSCYILLCVCYEAALACTKRRILWHDGAQDRVMLIAMTDSKLMVICF